MSRNHEFTRGHLLFVICVPVLLGGFLVGYAAFVVRQSVEEPSRPSISQVAQSPVPRQVRGVDFVGSSACRSCHEKFHASWSASYHSKMTRLASPESIVGDFNGVDLTYQGLTYQLTRRGEQYWVRMPDPDRELPMLAASGPAAAAREVPLVDKQVLMVTGSHHFQVYWIASEENNALRQMPWYYFIQEQKWVPGIYTMLQPHDSQQSLQAVSIGFWNGVCVKCHSVAGAPGLDPETGKFSSWVAEFGISCEACHGPGGAHVRRQKRQRTSDDDTIVNPAKVSSKTSAQICGQCHSSFVPANEMRFQSYGLGYRAGGNLEQSHKLLRYDDPQLAARQGDGAEMFWNDGTCRVGGDEYTAMVESGCFKRGELSCLSCHSMHQSDPNDQLAAQMDGDQACLQCHSELRERLTEHTHHAADSAGSRCYNCHMPHTSWALMKAIRNHRVSSPQVSPQHDRPNACNLCHIDQSLQWTAEHLTNWYQQPPSELGEDAQLPAAAVWALRGNAVERVVAAWHLGWQPAREASGHAWLAPVLGRLLDDPYSVVRYTAHRALLRLPEFEDLSYEFVASPEQLRSGRQTVLERWRAAQQTAPATLPPSLATPAGQLREDLLDQLQQQRDDTPVRIPE